MPAKIKLITVCFLSVAIINLLFAEPDIIQKYIMTDQFGYRPDDIRLPLLSILS